MARPPSRGFPDRAGRAVGARPARRPGGALDFTENEYFQQLSLVLRVADPTPPPASSVSLHCVVTQNF